MIRQKIYLILGFICLALGLVGAFLPILPTTPFAILAAYLFSKSSPKMENYVLNLPGLGPLVRDWRNHKVINPKAKFLCVLMIIIVMGLSIYKVNPSIPIQSIMIIIALSVITFVLSRESYR